MVADALRHLALVVALAAVVDAGWTLAGSTHSPTLLRALAAAPITVALIVVEILILGLLHLGGSTQVILGTTLLIWGTVRLLMRGTPALDAEGNLVGIAVASVVAAPVLVAWVSALLWHPAIGADGAVYHVPEILHWVQTGAPGSTVATSGFPGVEYYPIANELLFSWGVGLSHSWVPFALWAPVTYILLGLGLWIFMRAVGATRVGALLGIAVVITVPLLVYTGEAVKNDFPAAMWLAVAAALGINARWQTRLAGPALLAAGLAAATKPVALPLALIIAGATAWESRRAVSTDRFTAGCAIAAFGVGGVFYVRNTVVHGWPLWPFSAAPWGTPIPSYLSDQVVTLLSRPVATLTRQPGDFRHWLGGALLVWPIAAAAIFASRSKVTRTLGGLTVLSLIAYAAAPSSGAAAHPRFNMNLSLFNLRFLLPAVIVGAVTAAVLTGHGERSWVRRGAYSALVLATLANVTEIARQHGSYIWAVRPGAVLAGLTVGALGALVVSRLPGPRRRLVGPIMVGVLGIALVTVGTAAASGYEERLADGRSEGHHLLSWLLQTPAYTSGRDQVAVVEAYGPLAGDALQHRIALLTPECPVVRRHLSQGFLLVLPAIGIERVAGRCMTRDKPVFADNEYRVYARPGALKGYATVQSDVRSEVRQP
jgi:hypothetical protein